MSDIEKPDVIGATRRAETIRNGMIGYAAAMEAIGEAYEARDWAILGYKTWDDYCEKEFSEKRLKLTQQQREQAVLAFRGAGMSIRAIGSALGLPKSSVADTLSQVSEPGHLPAEVKGADGKTYSPVKTSPGPASPVDGAEGAAGSSGPAVPSDSPSASAVEPEEDHPGTADLGEVEDLDSSTADGVGAPSDARPQAGDVSNGASGDETKAEAESPRPDSAEVELPQGQEAAGVTVAAPAGDPERSEGDEGQGQAAASVPAPPIPSWLTAITAVCTAVHDLDEEDPLVAAPAVEDDLAAELGSAVLMVTAWYRRMQEAK